MHVEAIIDDDATIVGMPDGSTIMDLMGCLGLFIEGTVAVIDGTPVPETLPLRDGMRVRLVSVGSSG